MPKCLGFFFLWNDPFLLWNCTEKGILHQQHLLSRASCARMLNNWCDKSCGIFQRDYSTVFSPFIRAFTTGRTRNNLKKSPDRGLKMEKEMVLHKKLWKPLRWGGYRCQRHSCSLALASPPTPHCLTKGLWLWSVAVLGIISWVYSPKVKFWSFKAHFCI